MGVETRVALAGEKYLTDPLALNMTSSAINMTSSAPPSYIQPSGQLKLPDGDCVLIPNSNSMIRSVARNPTIQL